MSYDFKCLSSRKSLSSIWAQRGSFSTKGVGIISHCINCTNYPPLNQPQLHICFGHLATSQLLYLKLIVSLRAFGFSCDIFFSWGNLISCNNVCAAAAVHRPQGLYQLRAPQQFHCKCAVAPTFAFFPSAKCYITRVPLFPPFLYPYHNTRIFAKVWLIKIATCLEGCSSAPRPRSWNLKCSAESQWKNDSLTEVSLL